MRREAVIELLRPVRERYAELASDPQAVRATMRAGAGKAQAVAAGTLARAREAIGLLPERLTTARRTLVR